MLNNRLTVLCKSAFVCLLICFVTWNTHAQSTVTIGTGTATDYNFPFQPYFNNGWSSQIYTATEIGTAGTINSLAFYVNNSSGSYTLDNQKIYVRHTSVSQHADKFYPGTTGFTLVYSGSITFGTSGWKTINLSSPFAYNGTSNLEVLIESRDGSTFTSALQTRYTSKSEYRTKYDYNDYNFPTTWYAGGRVTKLPNIQFVINTCSVVAGTISTTTPSICSGSTASLTLSGQTSGQTIQWQTSTDNTTFSDIAGANSATYTTPALTTASYYRAKVGSGSCIVTSSSQSIAILSLPTAPTVGSNSPVCVGSSLNLTASTIAGASYAWTGPNGFISSLQNPVVNTQADTIHRGAYTLVISLNGCSSSAQTTSIVYTYPSTLAVTASNLRIQAGESTTLTASGVTNYTWDSNLGTGGVKVVSPTQTTTYTVSGDNGNACVAQESITIDVVNPTNTGVNSETVSIGTGTATDYNVPLQTYFNYGWSSQLYLASEIRGAGYLNSLSFYTVNSGSTYTLENQKVYVRHTQESSFADKYYPTTTGFTLVYSGPVTITSSGWLTIPFSSAFNYNGTSNLEVLLESRDGSTFTSAIQTRYTNQSGTSIYRTKFDYNNNEFPANYNQGGKLHHYANIQFNKTVCNLPSLTLTSNSPVCAGGILQLSTDTIQGATYTWTGPNGYTSTSQVPNRVLQADTLKKGLYTLLAKVGNCEKRDSIFIQIGTPLTFTPIVGSDSICKGDTVLYAHAIGSGTWSSSDSLIAKVNTNGNLVSLQAGSFTLNYKLTGSLGCKDSILSKTVVVNSKPSIGTIVAPGFVTKLGIDSIYVDSLVGQGTWQTSQDSLLFTDVQGVFNKVLPIVNLDSIRYFRLKVQTSNCSPVYSTVYKVTVFNGGKIKTLDSLINKGDTIRMNLLGSFSGLDLVWQQKTGSSFVDVTSANTSLFKTKLDTNACFRVKLSKGSFLKYSDTVCIRVLNSTVGIDTFYITTHRLGYSGSPDIIIPKAVASANRGNDVFVLLDVKPRSNGSALIPFNEDIPAFNFEDGNIFMAPSRGASGVQGFDFTDPSISKEQVRSFFGRTKVRRDGVNLSTWFAMRSNVFYELKRRLDGEIYEVSSIYSALSLSCMNHNASCNYTYYIYNSEHKLIQSAPITLNAGKNRFTIDFEKTMKAGVYNFELHGPKGEKLFCKYYTSGYANLIFNPPTNWNEIYNGAILLHTHDEINTERFQFSEISFY